MPSPPHSLLYYRLPLVIAGTVIFYLATIPAERSLDLFGWDKLNHAMAFVVLALLLDFSFPKRAFDYLKCSSLLAYGLLIELVQYMLPTRSFSLLDLLADSAGILLYLLSRSVLKMIPCFNWRWAR